jgi:quercetin dioxygenase-like cupin family protein
MSVRHATDVEATNVAAGERTTIQVLIPATEGPSFAMRRFIMQPGGGMPRHTNTVEHEQYVLRGRAHIGVDADEYDVVAGDVVFIPEGVPHFYRNSGDEPFEFLCLIPNRPDIIRIVEEDRTAE